MVPKTDFTVSSSGTNNGERSGRYVGDLRRGFNSALFPLDPYLAPMVGLIVGVWLLLLDMVSAEAPALMRVSALFGSLLLISDASSGLRRAFARTEPVYEVPLHPPVSSEVFGSPTAVPPRKAYVPAAAEEVAVVVDEPKKRRMTTDNPLGLISLAIALVLGLAALGPSTTSMRLLSMAATILICIRVYDAMGLRKE